MKGIIQDVTAIVLLVGVLFTSAKSTLKKGADLYRYAVRISKEIRKAPQHEQITPAAGKKPRTLSLASLWPWLFIPAQIAITTWHVADSSPVTKIVVLRISLDVAVLMFMALLVIIKYLLLKILDLLKEVIDVIGSLARETGSQEAL